MHWFHEMGLIELSAERHLIVKEQRLMNYLSGTMQPLNPKSVQYWTEIARVLEHI